MTALNQKAFLNQSRGSLGWLMLAAMVMIFAFLGARDIWTQEHRWADIVAGMFYRHDFLHPYLGQNDYYDKPLLSYWLIAVVAKITGELTTWSLRLPSAMAGLLAVWSIYWLGAHLKDRSFGILSGWLLLTTFYFLFWARTSSADMLNLGGTLFAIAWYMDKREQPSFYHYTVFFLAVVLTSLCKGLVGAIVPAIAVLVDVILRGSWRQYATLRLWTALIFPLVIYILPFWASSYFSDTHYKQNGLYLVYRENILRYFQPFDHQGPIYTYFVYLPIYTLPWAIFLLPALVSMRKRWNIMPLNTRWIAWTLLALFVFFTMSGSRRSYYVIPLIPFAILLVADWMQSTAKWFSGKQLTISIGVVFLVMLLVVDVLPAWYYSKAGVGRFAQVLQTEAGKTKPWSSWQIVLLDAESKINFYLKLPPTTLNYQIKGSTRDEQTLASLQKSWPIFGEKPLDTVYITRKQYVPLLLPYFSGYTMVELSDLPRLPLMPKREMNKPVAFIPKT